MKEIRIRLQNALNDKNVESLFRIDLMNIFKVLGIDYPRECELLTNHILLDLKTTENLENFEKTTNSTFQNYKVLGKDLLKVISAKNKLYHEAMYLEIKKILGSNMIISNKKISDLLKERCIFYNKDADCVFVVNFLSHCLDLDSSLENITNLTKKRIIVVETVPFYTDIKEAEINKNRTFLNDYFCNRIFCGKTSIPFLGNYQTTHNWNLFFAKNDFEVRSSLSRNFDLHKYPIIVKTNYYIGVYDKVSKDIRVDCK